MVRTQIYLTKSQRDGLKAIAKTAGKKQSELIREAIDRLIVAFMNSYSDRIILSSIVVAELFAGAKGSAEQVALEEFVSLFRVVPVNVEIAKAGGLYKSKFGKSHGVGLADAILAATAEAENADLKTLTTKHYPMLKGLTPAYKK